MLVNNSPSFYYTNPSQFLVGANRPDSYQQAWARSVSHQFIEMVLEKLESDKRGITLVKLTFNATTKGNTHGSSHYRIGNNARLDPKNLTNHCFSHHLRGASLIVNLTLLNNNEMIRITSRLI